jgi:hypothetical protein
MDGNINDVTSFITTFNPSDENSEYRRALDNLISYALSDEVYDDDMESDKGKLYSKLLDLHTDLSTLIQC